MTDLQLSPIKIKNSNSDWFSTIVIATAIFLFFWHYLYIRGKLYTLFSVNRSLALAGTILICVSLMQGAFYRLTGMGKGAISLRRPLGIVGTAAVLGHVAISVFCIPKFDLDYYISKLVSIIIGSAGTILLLLIVSISFGWALKKLGSKKWKMLQMLGYAAVILILLHVVYIGKGMGWYKWLQKGALTSVPNESVIALFFCVLTVLMKLLDLLMGRRSSIQATAD